MGVPVVDPHRSSRLLRAAASFVRSPAGRWFAMHVSAHVDPVLLKVTGGRVSTFGTAPIVNLTVPGRKSGEPRSAALLYFNEGDEVILIASSFGREKHPGWYYNVKAHPQVTLTAGGATEPYVAREVTDPEEREKLYALANLLYPGYAEYEVTAGAAGRTIPVLALKAAA